uniref:Putative secreted protein n=1 Tax=Amblyomma triste TaxID=251400 RepID=A0A023G3W7_AMBTT
MKHAGFLAIILLLSVSSVNAGRSWFQTRRPTTGSCGQWCDPRSSEPTCPPLCGCYQDVNSKYYGRCFEALGPYPKRLQPKYFGPATSGLRFGQRQ